MIIVPRRLYSRASRIFGFPALGKTPKQRIVDDVYSIIGALQGQAAGTTAVLPLAHRVLERLTKIIDHELDEIDAQKVHLPILCPAKPWKLSGRWDDYGSILFKLKDRTGNEFCLGPTHEESITKCIAGFSPNDLRSKVPIKLYQIQWKYRDEDRPKKGLLRAREFLMKDMYSFDIDEKSSYATYEEVTQAYVKIFKRIGLPFTRALASSGNMGGSFSHEFHYALPDGEDKVFTCADCSESFNDEVVTDAKCPKCSKTMSTTPGVEIGHTFVLGDSYSRKFNANCAADGKPQPLQMGCYGIGVTRILSAAALFDGAKELRLPPSIAPFTVGVIGPKKGSHEHDELMPSCLQMCERLDAILPSKRVLLDDRSWTIGKRLIETRAWGVPYQVVLSKNGLELHGPEGQIDVSSEDSIVDYFGKLVEERGLL